MSPPRAGTTDCTQTCSSVPSAAYAVGASGMPRPTTVAHIPSAGDAVPGVPRAGTTNRIQTCLPIPYAAYAVGASGMPRPTTVARIPSAGDTVPGVPRADTTNRVQTCLSVPSAAYAVDGDMSSSTWIIAKKKNSAPRFGCALFFLFAFHWFMRSVSLSFGLFGGERGDQQRYPDAWRYRAGGRRGDRGRYILCRPWRTTDRVLL